MITSTYVDIPDGNRQLSTHGVVYKPYVEKGIESYVDAEFSAGWAQEDSYNAENDMSCMGYIITYAVFPVLW